MEAKNNKKKMYQQVDELLIINYQIIKLKNSSLLLDCIAENDHIKHFTFFKDGYQTLLLIKSIKLNKKHIQPTLSQPFSLDYTKLLSINTKNKRLDFIKKSEKCSYYVGSHLRIIKDFNITLNIKELKVPLYFY